MKKHRPIKRFRSEISAKDLYRIPLTLTPEMDAWLLDLSARMKSSGGYRLPKSYCLRALLGAAMKLKINVKGVKDQQELQERIAEAIRKHK